MEFDAISYEPKCNMVGTF